MSRAGRWLRRISLIVLIVLLSIVLLLGWLLGTESGARFALRTAIERSPGTLAVDAVSGTFLDGLTLDGIRFQLQDLELQASRIALDVEPGVLWNFRRVEVSALEIQQLELLLPASPPGQAPPAPDDFSLPPLPRVSLPLALIVDAFDLRGLSIRQRNEQGSSELLVLESVQFSGRMQGTAIAIDNLNVVHADGQVTAAGDVALDDRLPLGLAIGWRYSGAAGQPLQGRLTVDGNRSGWQVEHQLAAPYPLNSTATVIALPDAPVRIDSDHVADAMTVVVSERELTIDEFRLSLAGSPGDWQLSLTSRASEAELPPLSVALSANGTLAGANIERLRLQTDDDAVVVADGKLGWRDGLSYDGEVNISGFPLQWLDDRVDGVIAADFALSVQQTPQWQASATIRSLDGTLQGYAMSASGIVAYRDQRLSVTDGLARVGENRLVAGGTLARDGRLDFTLDIDAPDLAALASGLDGGLRLNGRVRGNAQAPDLDVTIASENLVYQQYALSALSGRVRLADARWQGDVRIGRLDAGPRVLKTLSIDVQGELADHELRLAGVYDELLELRIALAGGYDAQRWQGVLSALDADFLQAALPDQPLIALGLEAPATLTLSQTAFAIGDFCLRSADSATLCGAGEWRDSALDAEARIRDLIITPWLAALNPSLQWFGNLSADVRLSGPLDALNGSARIEVADAAVLATVTDASGAAREDRIDISQAQLLLAINDNALNARAGLGVGEAATLTADLSLSDLWRADATLDGGMAIDSTSLNELNALVDELQINNGKLTVQARLAGTRAQPQWRGELQADGLNLIVVPLGVRIRDGQITAETDARGEVTFIGSAGSGDGFLTVSGGASAGGDEGFALQAKVAAERFQFIDLPDMSGDASMDLDFAATAKRYRLNGVLTLDRANVVVREFPEGAVRVSTDSREFDEAGDLIVRERSTPLSGELDLRLRFTDSVQLSGFGLQTGLEGELRLRQKADQDVRGVGTLQLRDATYTAYGQRLEVSRGQLVFNGPLDNPRLDIRAERQVDKTTVGIDVIGTPTQLSSQLFSSPPLPDAEAFSLLLTGRNLAAANTEQGSTMADAAITLGLKQAFGVSGSIRDAVGLDTLTVAGSGRSGRLLAGKAIAPNLYLQYAYGVFDQVSTVLLRLKLNDRLSLESSSGETQSVDLIYSVGRQ